MRQLARTDRDGLNRANYSNLGSVECVTSARGLILDGIQVRVDGQTRVRMRFETLKLRVVRITPRLAADDCLGQQSLPPQGNQPLRI